MNLKIKDKLKFFRDRENLEKLEKGKCPSKNTCILCAYEGQVYCLVHENKLNIIDNWEHEDIVEQIPMRHILYVACSNGKENEILIDEEQ